MIDKDTMRQVEMMDADRQRLVERLKKATPGSYEYQDLLTAIKAHDDQVSKLLGLDVAAKR